MSKPAALYARFSKGEKTLRSQMREVFDLARRSGCEVVATFDEERELLGTGSIGGADLARLISDEVRPSMGIAIGWTTDRLGRTLHHLVITPPTTAPAPF